MVKRLVLLLSIYLVPFYPVRYLPTIVHVRVQRREAPPLPLPSSSSSPPLLSIIAIIAIIAMLSLAAPTAHASLSACRTVLSAGCAGLSTRGWDFASLRLRAIYFQPGTPHASERGVQSVPRREAVSS
jgi:hypothetical protein